MIILVENEFYINIFKYRRLFSTITIKQLGILTPEQIFNNQFGFQGFKKERIRTEITNEGYNECYIHLTNDENKKIVAQFPEYDYI